MTQHPQPLGGNEMPRFGGPATMMRLPAFETAEGLDVAFVGGKHHLHEVVERFAAQRYVHIGDTHVDKHYALLAGFEFCELADWETLAQA